MAAYTEPFVWALGRRPCVQIRKILGDLARLVRVAAETPRARANVITRTFCVTAQEGTFAAKNLEQLFTSNRSGF